MKDVLSYLGMAVFAALFLWFMWVALPNYENMQAAIRACDQHETAEAFDECKAEYYRRRDRDLPE